MGPAAAAMDSMYRLQRHIYDLTRKPYLLGRDRLIAELAVPAGGSVLEIGCGTARNLILIARRYLSARCHGVDVSSEMLRTATRAIARAGLRERVSIAFADATQFDPAVTFGQGSFDRVVISYALSMIPSWGAVLEQAVALTAPGGIVAVVDFGDMAGLPGLVRGALRSWLDCFSVSPRLDLRRRCETLAARNGARCVIVDLHGGYATLARILLK